MKDMLLEVKENQEKYGYQYDNQYEIGIKITFLKSNTGSVTNKIIQTLSKQYIQKIISDLAEGEEFLYEKS